MLREIVVRVGEERALLAEEHVGEKMLKERGARTDTFAGKDMCETEIASLPGNAFKFANIALVVFGIVIRRE